MEEEKLALKYQKIKKLYDNIVEGKKEYFLELQNNKLNTIINIEEIIFTDVIKLLISSIINKIVWMNSFSFGNFL